MREVELSLRSRELIAFDEALRRAIGAYRLIGVDEAGRGPLAGPVFAAAVEFDVDTRLDCIYDSKSLNEKDRNKAYKMIISEASAFSVASATAKEIDEINIRQASLLAMRRAVSLIGSENTHILVDGKDILGHNLISQAVIKGDRTSLSIAAASILAKVARDEYMARLDEEYPGYGFALNKGYPTRDHLEALKWLGPAPCHRVTFRGVLHKS